MNTIYLDEKVGEHQCQACRIRKAKRRLKFDFGDGHKMFLCDLCFDDIRNLMIDTFWTGERKTRDELRKENPILIRHPRM